MSQSSGRGQERDLTSGWVNVTQFHKSSTWMVQVLLSICHRTRIPTTTQVNVKGYHYMKECESWCFAKN